MVRSEKKAEASVSEQHAASYGSLATYKPENDMSQGMQFLARLLMNVGAGMNTGSFNPGKGAGMGSQPQAKPLLCKMHLPFQWMMQSVNNALDLFANIFVL